ncbi:hypothetical protein M8013_09015 [Enterobacteriaceae bacterium H4N4]|uniref:Uncharacterized protein n=1 Tax=Silvania confinis TaxID=2926470 RepID=A0A9J6QD54_9ENTR|nr:hypothetical protein [Silvania confinis]MCU6668889.1 hypothetical protein [Silvania confinis]
MEFEINTKSLAIIIPVAISIIGGSFYLGFTINSARVEHFKDTIEEYKKSNQLDAPGLLSSLRQSATALTLSATERRALDEAKVRVDQYASRIGVCEAKLSSTENSLTNTKENLAKGEAQCSASIVKLKEQIESYVKESAEIKTRRGGSVELIPNKARLGLSAVFTNSATININSESMNINIGEGKDILIDNIKCKLWLTELDVRNDQATFKFNCSL